MENFSVQSVLPLRGRSRAGKVLLSPGKVYGLKTYRQGGKLRGMLSETKIQKKLSSAVEFKTHGMIASKDIKEN